MRKVVLVFILTLCALSFAQAQPQDPGSADRLIEDVLQNAGGKAQIQEVEALLERMLKERENNSDPELHAQLSKAFRESYRSDLLYRSVFSHFRKNFDKSRLEAYQEWLQLPLAQKVTQMEVHASTPEGRQELIKFAKKARYLTIPKQRREMVKRMDASINLSGKSEELVVAIAQTMVKGFNAITPEDKRLSPEQVEAMPQQVRLQLKGMVRESTEVALLGRYRDLTDAELEQYAQFCESELGRWINDLWLQAISKAFTVATEDAAKKLASSTAGVAANR